jgi:hypothetical protein
LNSTLLRRGRVVKTPSPEFRFDPVPHTYYLGTRILPSITQILVETKYIDKTYYTDEARLRGTHVHQAIHYLNKGTLDWSDLEDKYFGYVMGYEKFVKDWNLKLEIFEKPMYHPSLFFAGTPDIVGTVLDNIPAIVELKTGNVPDWAAQQTIAQEMLVNAWEVKPIRRRRFGLKLNANGTYSKPVEFKNFMLDEVTFKSNNVSVQHRPLYGAQPYGG